MTYDLPCVKLDKKWFHLANLPLREMFFLIEHPARSKLHFFPNDKITLAPEEAHTFRCDLRLHLKVLLVPVEHRLVGKSSFTRCPMIIFIGAREYFRFALRRPAILRSTYNPLLLYLLVTQVVGRRQSRTQNQLVLPVWQYLCDIPPVDPPPLTESLWAPRALKIWLEVR